MTTFAYRRLESPLHATRAGVAVLYCLALAGAALASDSPAVLTALGVCVLLASNGARVSGDVARSMRFAAPLALLFALLNPVVSRNGLTVFARLGEVPPFGQIDLTVEALVYGLVFGLRLVVVIGAFSLLSAVVDPDALLALLRRVSPRSALTAVLATRMLPVLARDARRIEDARHCRADGGGSGPGARLAVVRAVTAGALDRAMDVAATLEVRGYGALGRPPRRVEPWSRHDAAFLAAGAGVGGLGLLAWLADLAAFDPYPTITASFDPVDLVLCAGLVVVALAPFADRRGIA